jgi:hypothetical protein
MYMSAALVRVVAVHVENLLLPVPETISLGKILQILTGNVFVQFI